jgi:hypothetical protein
MKFFENLAKKFVILLCGMMCMWSVTANAYIDDSTALALDGSNNTIAVWRILNVNRYQLQAAYGTGSPWTPVNITQTTGLNAEDVLDFPFIVVSKDVSTNIRAAVTWISRDISTSLRNIRVSVYDSTLGTWSTPKNISSGTVDEIVRADYLADISSDGLTITVTWASFFTSLGQYVLRSAISTDGGLNFTTTNIANLGTSFSSFF